MPSSDGIEFGGEAAESLDAAFDILADLVQVDVPRHELREGVGNADDWPSELCFAHAVGAPEASGSGHAAARRGDGTSEWVFHPGRSVAFPAVFPEIEKASLRGGERLLACMDTSLLPLSWSDDEQANDDDLRMFRCIHVRRELVLEQK